MNSVLLFGASPRPACAGAARRFQPSSSTGMENTGPRNKRQMLCVARTGAVRQLGSYPPNLDDAHRTRRILVRASATGHQEKWQDLEGIHSPHDLCFENNAQAGLLMQMFITYAQGQRADWCPGIRLGSCV